MKKKIVLVNPPYPIGKFPSPHLGLIALGTFLEKNGYHVIIEDYIVNPCTPERVRDVIEKFRPHYLGITAATMNINRALAIAGEYRKIDPGIIVMAGGPHVTFDAGNIIRDNIQVDYIVRGEGEITCLELLHALDTGGDLRGIPGLSFRENREIVHNPDRPFIADINMLPIPSTDMMEVSKYKALGLPVNMITSRGCPFQCIFCAGGKMFGHRVRYYDVKRVVDEFESLSRHGTRQINIADDLFTSNEKRCIEICNEIIRRGIVYPWTAFARVDTVTPGLLSSMKEAGCTTVCFGIESGTQEILDRIKKKTTIEKCIRAVALCREAGIEPMTSFILGLPGETCETAERTLAFSRSLGKNRGYHILAPFPGTELREHAGEYGIRILSDNWDEYDTTHTVSESIHYPASEIGKIAGDYYESIRKYVAQILHKAMRGDLLDAEESALAARSKSFIFVEKMITGQLAEKYRGKNAEHEIDEFVAYLSEETGYESDDVRREVEELIKSDCIKIIHEGTRVSVSWV